MKIAVWSCGQWCHIQELADYLWMSDDFEIVELYDYISDDDVDAIASRIAENEVDGTQYEVAREYHCDVLPSLSTVRSFK